MGLGADPSGAWDAVPEGRENERVQEQKVSDRVEDGGGSPLVLLVDDPGSGGI